MIRTLIPLYLAGCFCVLAAFSYGRFTPTPETLGEFAARQVANYQPRVAKPVYIWRTAKAATIADVWNITPESLDSKLDILGRRR